MQTHSSEISIGNELDLGRYHVKQMVSYSLWSWKAGIYRLALVYTTILSWIHVAAVWLVAGVRTYCMILIGGSSASLSADCVVGSSPVFPVFVISI
jgi:hypothetical protein